MLQPVQHPVEYSRQPSHLIIARIDLNALLQVITPGNPLRCFLNLPDRRKKAPGQQTDQQDAQQNQQGQGNQAEQSAADPLILPWQKGHVLFHTRYRRIAHIVNMGNFFITGIGSIFISRLFRIIICMNRFGEDAENGTVTF